MRYQVKWLEFTYRHSNTCFIENWNGPIPVDSVQLHRLGEFKTKEAFEIDDVICIDDKFWFVSEKVFVTPKNKKTYVELWVKPFKEGIPYNYSVYYPDKDIRQIHREVF